MHFPSLVKNFGASSILIEVVCFLSDYQLSLLTFLPRPISCTTFNLLPLLYDFHSFFFVMDDINDPSANSRSDPFDYDILSSIGM